MRSYIALIPGLLIVGSAVAGDEDPRPTPLTRPDMKQFLEDMKSRKPRIPLPELTAEEKAKLGEREAGYEGRLRALTCRPAKAGPAVAGRRARASLASPIPTMTLDYKFKTQLFWIVSRTNNCQYCLGHQESKLLGAGMKEDEIAALDGDWSEFTPAERAAFAFARKFTYEPHRLTDADIDGLRKLLQGPADPGDDPVDGGEQRDQSLEGRCRRAAIRERRRFPEQGRQAAAGRPAGREAHVPDADLGGLQDTGHARRAALVGRARKADASDRVPPAEARVACGRRSRLEAVPQTDAAAAAGRRSQDA